MANDKKSQEKTETKDQTARHKESQKKVEKAADSAKGLEKLETQGLNEDALEEEKKAIEERHPSYAAIAAGVAQDGGYATTEVENAFDETGKTPEEIRAASKAATSK